MLERNNTEPLFIVGVPRSGTTLLTSYLVSHPNIVSGAETQFFNKIGEDEAALEYALQEENWPYAAYDLMKKKLTLSGASVLELYCKDRESIILFLSSRKPSLGAMLESIVIRNTDTSSPRRWLEKTPNHINHLNDIRTHFPSAKILLIIRDPRDSAASIAKLPWAPKSTLANALLVENWLANTYKGFEENNNCLTVSYERLITNTEEELKRVFSFIGEEYSSSILEKKSASEVTTVAEPWKQDVHRAIDKNHLALWKKRVPKPVLTQIERIMSACLVFFSYGEPVTDHIQRVELIRVNNQQFVGLDDFADVINKNNICLSTKKLGVSLLYLEKGKLLAVLFKSLKVRLSQKKKIVFVGRKIPFLRVLGSYLE